MRLYYTETRYIYFLSTNKCTRKGPIIPKWNTRRLKWMCCNTGSISKLSIARRARFMGFCKSRLKTVRGGQILKPWRGKGSWNQIRFVSNPTNDFTRNGRRMLMTYRGLGERQLSLPCFCWCPSKETLKYFTSGTLQLIVIISGISLSLSLFFCRICSSITNDCVPFVVLYLNFLCILKSTWTALNFLLPRLRCKHCIFMTIENVLNWQRFDFVMIITKLSVRRSYNNFLCSLHF